MVSRRCGSSVHCHGANRCVRGGVDDVREVLASKIVREVSALHLASAAVLVGVRHALDFCTCSFKRRALKVADSHECRFARFGSQYDLARVGKEPSCTDFGLHSCRNSGRGRWRGQGWRSSWLLGDVGLKQASRLANNGGCGSWLVVGLDGGRWLACRQCRLEWGQIL